MTYKYYPLIVLLLVTHFLKGQDQDKSFKFRQGSIKGEIIDGIKYTIFRKITKKRVVFSFGKDLLFCDYAIRNEITKNMKAYGNVIIKQKKGSNIRGDSLFYFKNEDWVEIRGNVIAKQKEIKLSTDILYYDTKTKNARYTEGGKVKKKNIQLVSRKGYIENNTNHISFKENVVLDDFKEKQHLECDTLSYDINTEIVTFPSSAFIKTEDGFLNTQKGEYNTKNGAFYFKGGTFTENENFKLEAENIKKNKEDITIAQNKAKLFSKKDSITIYGQEIHHSDEYNYSKVYGIPMMMKPLVNDTFFLVADTFISSENEENKQANLLAFHNVKIVMQQLQGSCDSLVYHFNDSSIHFYGDPVLWNEKNQISADSIYVQLKDNQIDKIFLKKNCFIIMEDTLGNYNQIKGREIVASLKDSNISYIHVNGNAQSLYFAIKQDEELNSKYRTIGMNKSDCGNITLLFNEKNQIEIFSCINRPDSKLIPLHELKEPDKRLPKFKIRNDKRPEKILVYKRKNDQ